MVNLYASEEMNTGDIAYINDKTGDLIMGGRADGTPTLVAPIDIESGDLITFDPMNGRVISVERNGKIVWAATKERPYGIMAGMRNDEKEIIVRWIVQNVDDRDVPLDEGNAEALVYNLVQLARHGRPYESYNYQPEQDEEIKKLGKQYGNAWLASDE